MGSRVRAVVWTYLCALERSYFCALVFVVVVCSADPWQAPTCLQGWIGAEPDVKQERYSTNENAELKRIRHGFQ